MNISQSPAYILNEVQKLEQKGLYTQARRVLNEFWVEFNDKPDTSNLSDEDAAEVLLRCGAVAGFLGTAQQIENAQEVSKNLLGEAHRLFILLENTSKTVETLNHIALTYWRTGENSEARTWLKDSYKYDLSDNDQNGLHRIVIDGLIFMSESRYKELIMMYRNSEQRFESNANDFYKGCFYNNLGIAYKNLNEIELSLEALSKSRESFISAKHELYLGNLENSFAQCYLFSKQYIDANISAMQSVFIFRSLGDKPREAVATETLSQIKFAENNFTEALKHINTAIEILRNSERYQHLIECYKTKIRILIKLDQITEAILLTSQAYSLAAMRISENYAFRIVEETSDLIEKRIVPYLENVYQSVEERIKIAVPNLPFLTKKQRFFSVKINNSRLDVLGLEKDDLAIIADIPVQKGEFIALYEKQTEVAHCGIFDINFQLISLEIPDAEPLIFNESEVEILGKIIGYATDETNEKGELIVKKIDNFELG